MKTVIVSFIAGAVAVPQHNNAAELVSMMEQAGLNGDAQAELRKDYPEFFANVESTDPAVLEQQWQKGFEENPELYQAKYEEIKAKYGIEGDDSAPALPDAPAAPEAPAPADDAEHPAPEGGDVDAEDLEDLPLDDLEGGDLEDLEFGEDLPELDDEFELPAGFDAEPTAPSGCDAYEDSAWDGCVLETAAPEECVPIEETIYETVVEGEAECIYETVTNTEEKEGEAVTEKVTEHVTVTETAEPVCVTETVPSETKYDTVHETAIITVNEYHYEYETTVVHPTVYHTEIVTEAPPAETKYETTETCITVHPTHYETCPGETVTETVTPTTTKTEEGPCVTETHTETCYEDVVTETIAKTIYVPQGCVDSVDTCPQETEAYGEVDDVDMAPTYGDYEANEVDDVDMAPSYGGDVDAEDTYGAKGDDLAGDDLAGEELPPLEGGEGEELPPLEGGEGEELPPIEELDGAEELDVDLDELDLSQLEDVPSWDIGA